MYIAALIALAVALGLGSFATARPSTNKPAVAAADLPIPTCPDGQDCGSN